MGAGLFKAPTSNFWSNSLNGGIDDSVTTITLNDATGLQAPGYVVINREDGNGTATPNSREIVKFTGISSNDLTGCTRGADNSTARSHSDGALVEATFTIGMHNDQRDAINAEHFVSGLHAPISSATVATLTTTTANNLYGTTSLFGTFDGWVAASETWTYSSWDDTNGVSTATITVPSDATTKYQAGMRVKFTQPTDGVKYGIITKVEATALTVFVNTDYDFDNEAISSPFYSPFKAPFGFDLDVDKWKVEATDTSTQTQASPTQNTWYNLGSFSIDVPIGAWHIYYRANAYVVGTSGQMYTTLSKVNNTEDDDQLSQSQYILNGTASAFMQQVNRYLKLSAKDTYYLNARTTQSGATSIAFQGAVDTTIIRAVCAYL